MKKGSITDTILANARELIAESKEPRSDDSCVIEAALDAIDKEAGELIAFVHTYATFRNLHAGNERDFIRRLNDYLSNSLSDIETALRIIEDAATTV